MPSEYLLDDSVSVDPEDAGNPTGRGSPVFLWREPHRYFRMPILPATAVYQAA